MFEAKKNEKSRKELLAAAKDLLSKAGGDGSVKSGLEIVIGILCNDAPNASKKTAETDEKIRALFGDIAKGIEAKDKIKTAQLCIDAVELINGRMADAVPEDRQKFLLEYKLEVYKSQEEAVMERLKKDPYNAKIASQVSQLRVNVNNIENQLKPFIKDSVAQPAHPVFDDLAEHIEGTGMPPKPTYSVSAKSLDDIEKANAEIEIKLDKENDAIKEQTDILKSLLEKRKTAADEDRAAIDSDINRHNALLQASRSRMFGLMQEREKNDEIMMRIYGEKDKKDTEKVSDILRR